MSGAQGQRPLRRLFGMLAGLIAWAVQFALVYGVTAVACARGHADATVMGVGLVPASILAATAVTAGAAAWVFASSLRVDRRATEGTHPTDRFLTHATMLISGLAVVTILWHGLPALVLPSCW